MKHLINTTPVVLASITITVVPAYQAYAWNKSCIEAGYETATEDRLDGYTIIKIYDIDPNTLADLARKHSTGEIK